MKSRELIFDRLVVYLLCVVYAISVLMFIRLLCVDSYRDGVLRAVSRCAAAEERRHEPWQWRYEAYGRVSFDEMMMKPYKPLRWFYPDKSFMRCESR